MRYFSLFSGIGGFELGIKRASNNQCSPECQEPTQKECKERRKRDTSEQGEGVLSRQNAPLCVGFSEINKYAIQVYQQHFPEHKNYGDATKIDAANLPDFDMLCGGFPCQSFSIAGKRKGFEDTRGTLFHEILRIASEKRPGTIFLENVKGLLSADEGRCFGVIICSLDELGYDVEWQVLNSKDFGVPQNRERVFIIGRLRGEPFREVFPLRQGIEVSNGKDSNEQGEQQGVCSTIDSRYGSLRCAGETYVQRTPLKFMNRNQRNVEGDYSFTVDGANTGGIIMPVQIGHSKDAWASKYGTNIGSQEEAYTIRKEQCNGVMVKNKIRRLTPMECERLQGFPDGWTEGISDSQRYKCLGNAVTVNVIEAIAETMLNRKVEG